MTCQHCTTEQPRLNIEGIQIVQFLNILMMKTEFRATLVKIHCHNNSIINLLNNDMHHLLEKVCVANMHQTKRSPRACTECKFNANWPCSMGLHARQIFCRFSGLPTDLQRFAPLAFSATTTFAMGFPIRIN